MDGEFYMGEFFHHFNERLVCLLEGGFNHILKIAHRLVIMDAEDKIYWHRINRII